MSNEIKLSNASKDLLIRMRRGIFPYIIMGRYYLLTREIGAGTIQRLIDNSLIINATSGNALFELTERGKTIDL